MGSDDHRETKASISSEPLAGEATALAPSGGKRPSASLGDEATALAPSGAAPPPLSVDGLPMVGEESYARRGEIARGGLGRIVEATDRRLKRVVALKELRRHSPEAAARFVREALVTARLQHPGIVPIYEAGRWSDGEPFYAMKLVSGTSLADAIAACTSLDARLALLPRVTTVADTIAYAHGQGVIHRDLKPHNVMCGEYGETVVIDWGLAKDLTITEPTQPSGGTHATTTGGSGDSSSETVAGTVMGTPAYMPPEQARGETVDERADVYALGAMLYHLLAGEPPYKGQDEGGVLAGPPRVLETVIAGVPRDLLAIVTKAMERERARRYPSARELAEDLRRFQTGNLVSVREYTARERFARWLRRYRATVMVAAGAAIVLAVFGAFSIVRIVDERDRANRETEVAQSARTRAETRDGDLTVLQARGQLERDPTATLAWLQQLADPRLDAAAASIAADAVSRGVAAHVLTLDAGRISGLVVGSEGRAWALGQQGKLFQIDTATGKVSLAWSGEPSTSLAATADARIVAFGTTHAVVVIARGQTESIPIDATAISVAIDGKGQNIAFGLLDGRVIVRGRGGGSARELDRFTREARVVAFSPDGTYLAAVGFDGTVAVYRLSDGQRVMRGARPASIWSLAWAPDGSAIATACDDGSAQIWPLDGKPPIALVGHSKAVLHVVFDARGEHVATGSRDRSAIVWTRAGKQIAKLAHDSDVIFVVPLADGGWASAGGDHVVKRWSRDGEPLAVLRGHDEFIPLLAVSPDGAWLASGGQDGTVRLWPTARDEEVVVTGASALTVARTNAAVASIQGDRASLRAPGAPPLELGAAADLGRLYVVGDRVVLGLGNAGKVVRFDSGRVQPLVSAPAELGAVTEQGGVVFGAGYDGKLWRWPDLGRPPDGLPADATYVLTVVRVPDGELVASGGADGTVRLWHPDGRVERVLHGAGAPFHHVAVSPDGKLVAGGDVIGGVFVWRIADGAELARYKHIGSVQALAFAPAGDRIVSTGDDHLVHVRTWDGHEQLLTGHQQAATSIAVSADGKLVAAGAVDGSVRVWDVTTLASRVLRGHHGAVRAAAFEPGGALVTGGEDHRALRWPPSAIAPPPVTAAPLRAWIAARTDATVR